MKNQAIQITVSGNTVKIKAYVNFTGDTNEEFGDTGKTYAEIVKEGIQERWTTTFNGSDYDFAKGIKGNVVTEIISMVQVKLITIIQLKNIFNLLLIRQMKVGMMTS